MLSATSPDTPNQAVKVAAVTHQEPAVASRRESCDRGLKPVALSHEFRGGLCQRRPWRHRRVDSRGTAAITSLTSADATAEDYLHVPEGRRDHVTAAETLRLHGLD